MKTETRKSKNKNACLNKVKASIQTIQNHLKKAESYDQSLMKNKINFFLLDFNSVFPDFLNRCSRLEKLNSKELKKLISEINDVEQFMKLTYEVMDAPKGLEFASHLDSLAESIFMDLYLHKSPISNVEKRIEKLKTTNLTDFNNLLMLSRNIETQDREIKRMNRMVKYLKRETTRLFNKKTCP